MKVYVSELPKDCLDCHFCQDIKVNAGMDRLLFCKANKGKAIKNIEKSFDKCIVKNEFQSLTDYTKQVCEKIRKYCDNEYYFDFAQTEGMQDNRCIELDKLNKFLDQIEKGEL